MLKHENCGGELKKLNKGKSGQYKCQICKKLIKMGHSISYGQSESYIKKQMK